MGKLKSNSMSAVALAVAIMAAAKIDVFIAAVAVRHGYAPSKSSKEGVLAVGAGLQLRALTALKESKRAKARAPPCTRGPFTLRGGNKLWNEWRAYNGTGSAASIIIFFLFSRSCRFAQPTLCHFNRFFQPRTTAPNSATSCRTSSRPATRCSSRLFQAVSSCCLLSRDVSVCVELQLQRAEVVPISRYPDFMSS